VKANNLSRGTVELSLRLQLRDLIRRRLSQCRRLGNLDVRPCGLETVQMEFGPIFGPKLGFYRPFFGDSVNKANRIIRTFGRGGGDRTKSGVETA
jgi:hypothetical protein